MYGPPVRENEGQRPKNRERFCDCGNETSDHTEIPTKIITRMYKKHFRLSQKKIIFYRQTSSPRIVPLKKCDLSKCKSRKKNTGIQEYVFARALGNPNRNTTTHHRLLKIF